MSEGHTWLEWLQQVRPGEVAVVIRFHLPDKRDDWRGEQWGELTVEQHPVTTVNARHVTAAGLRFRRTWTGGDAGQAVTGQRLRPLAELEQWQARARVHAAYNRLRDLDALGWPQFARLRVALRDTPPEVTSTVAIAEALERMVALREEIGRVATSAAQQIEAGGQAYWARG